MKVAGNDKAYFYCTVRPYFDQRTETEIYKAGISVVPLQEVILPPFTRAIITVSNKEKLPGNICGYILQDDAWQDDFVFVEYFFIERSDPEHIKITLANKSPTFAFKLRANISYGGLVITRFRKVDDRYFVKLRENFRTEIIDLGKTF